MTDDQGSPLSGRVALVTGGSRGIGRATCLALAEWGADVAVNWSRSEDAANEVVAEIEAAGGRAIAVQASVESPEQDAAMVARVVSELGPIGILVNNGGIASKGKLAVDTPVEEVERLMAVHALGPHLLCGLIVPGMRDLDRGDVVMVSSIIAHTNLPTGAPYAMAKAALEALAYTLAQEEVGNGVHVNLVAPGLVASDMGDRLIKATSGGRAEGAADLDSESPFGHVCRPSEIAEVIRFLVSPQAGYLTGQRLVIDGGKYPYRG